MNAQFANQRRDSDRRSKTVIFSLAIVAFLASATPRTEAQTANETKGQIDPQMSFARQREVSLAVLRQLSDGNLDQALKELAVAADWGLPLSLNDRDELSVACAGVHRAMAQLSSEEQFELLSKWSLPGGSSPRIRMLAALVPTAAPPVEFSRVLGERPGGNPFPISSIGVVEGIYSTAWSLVTTARDCGKLKKLISDVAPLADRKVPGADLLLILVAIADNRADVTAESEQLAARTRRLYEGVRTAIGKPFVDRDNLVLAVAAVNHPVLFPQAEQFVKALIASTTGQPAMSLRPFLCRTHATACLLNENQEAKRIRELTLSANFKYWLPVARSVNGTFSLTSTTASWLVHEDHILHLAGAPDDALLLRFPLIGNFQFQVETQLAGQAEMDGSVTYDGLQFRVVGSNGEFTTRDVDGRVMQSRYCPFGHRPGQPSFNLFSIASTVGKITTSINLHPMWSEQNQSVPSPWIGLTSSGDARPLFRNLKFTGDPVIPRTVNLASGDQLRGWQSQICGPRLDVAAKEQSGWTIAKGVIQALRQTSAAEKTGLNQQLLSYLRPLLAGETIQYDFFYEAGKCEVSPALDRVAFLVRPDGIRLHWITKDDEWTSLPVDNTVVEPLSRRGPRPLPLKPADWNRLSVSRADRTVTLSLNDVVIYQRAIDWDGDHTFGLYRHGTGTDVKVREVVMTGNWPEVLPKEFLENPTAMSGAPAAAPEQRALQRIFREEFLASNVFAVRKRAMAMPLAERFQYLSDWILPGRDHPGIRMDGEFTPTRPAPVVREPGGVHPELGGEIVSPVFDWLDAARELGRLSECRRRVETIAVGSDDEQHRAQLSLLLMLGLESGDRTVADKEWSLLFERLKKEISDEVENHWPEFLLAARGVTRFPDNLQSGELAADLGAQRMPRWKRPDISRWHYHMASLNGQVQQRKRCAAAKNNADQVALRDWIPATGGRSLAYGSGHPDLQWNRWGDTVIKDSGNHHDYLFYRLPLTGDFQVECDFILPNQNPVTVMTAGTYIGLLGAMNGFETGTFRMPAPHVMFEPVLTNVGKPIRFRVEIQGNTRNVYANGRTINTSSLPPHRDPWIAFRSPWWRPSGFARVRINGSATVLDAVDLSQAPDLTGWYEYHEDAQWANVQQLDFSRWIVGKLNSNFAGTFTEGLLRYQRPLQDGETIEYDFFYQPGSVETAPALDRLALILHPAGVREHWITDGRHGPVTLPPDNVVDVPENRRGPAALPLNAGEWNRLIMSIRGTTARIELNGQLVYERLMEAENRLAFGLFHDVGATESRVRNVTLCGDWPKTLPSAADQELAGDTLEWLNAAQPQLKSEFTHRFDQEGLPEAYFEVQGTNPYSITDKGIQFSQLSDQSAVYWDIVPRFSVSGDFDLEASFCDARFTVSTNHAGILLRATFDDPQQPVYDIHRVMNRYPQHLTQASQAFGKPTKPGGGMWRCDSDAWETASGRLRLARRGKKLYNLIADGETGTFHLVSTEDVSQSDLVRHGIRLQSSALGGTSNATWKSVSLRAERLTWYPLQPKTDRHLLNVIQVDGTGSKTIADPISAGFTQIGSPEWSSDGRRIAVDMSNGSTTTSHIYVMNADGTDLQDLGLGCMPSFSGDGKSIAFSQPGNGIMMMKSDGSDREVIDRQGWGTQWSPDGKWIAYGKLGNITLLHVATRESRQLLEGELAMRYGYIYWNLAWSHDSRAVAFKGRKRVTNEDELAVAEMDGPNRFTVLLAPATLVIPDLTFSPDNKQVIGSFDAGDNQGYRLHAFSRSQPTVKTAVEVVPSALLVNGVAWSRDGKAIAVTSKQFAEPTEWVTGMKSNPGTK